MKRNDPTMVSSIEGLDTSKLQNFPYSSLKLLGGLQMGIGGACIVLGIIDLFLFLYVSPDYGSSTLTALTIASVPIWCGLWVRSEYCANCRFSQAGFGNDYGYGVSMTSLRRNISAGVNGCVKDYIHTLNTAVSVNIYCSNDVCRSVQI